MNQKHKELFSRLWHGADYNYEQWLDYPDILREDFRFMNQAQCTAMSVGIFSWAVLEPREGVYTFDWLDRLMDDLHGHGIRAILATPSAAQPAWLSKKYPEVLRMGKGGRREPHHTRQNFCRTSPVLREKCTQINTLLADRYKGHPALLLWHVSNEYGSTPCFCASCLTGFQRWLEKRYGDVDAVNQAWWTTFWSHRYSDWGEIEPFDPSNHGLMLDWQRYNSDQVLDFYLMEIAPLQQLMPHIPITTNFMRPDVGLDYWKIAEHVDVVSWDSYPEWHVHDDVQTAMETAFYHDLHRSYKQGQPFYLIESSPSQTNWQPLSRLKRPGLLKLASAQAVAHGAMGVNYFQWRQSRGGEEKFHGAVVAHRGGETARVFREVKDVGEMLAGFPELAGAAYPAQVGIIYDFENEWALNLAKLPLKAFKEYQKTCLQHYDYFWRQGVAVDILNAHQNLTPYKLVIAPMLYLLSEATATRLSEYVAEGGTLATTYLTGLVNETDLCYLKGSPLDAVLGVSVVEYDTFGPDQQGRITYLHDHPSGLEGSMACQFYAELLEPGTAEVMAVYASDFYQGKAAVTCNLYGKGKAYHLGTQVETRGLHEFYRFLLDSMEIAPKLTGDLPEGVSLQSRMTENKQYVFLMNFSGQAQQIELRDESLTHLHKEPVGTSLSLAAYDVIVLTKDLEKPR